MSLFSLHPSLVRNFFLPLHERVRKRKTFTYLQELEANQYKTREEIKVLQLHKLKQLLLYAYENVPYYQRLFRKIKGHPQDIKTFKDFEQVPVLTKEIIREHLQDIIDPKQRELLLYNHTSGSTGTPLIFYAHNRKEARGNTAKLRCRRWWGVEPGDRELHLWGNPVELDKAGKFRNLKDRMLNQIVVSAYDLSDQKMREFAGLIQTFRPKLVYGYPSALHAFCKYLNDKDLDLSASAPACVITTAEMLLEDQKASIGNTLQTKVVNEFGSHDGCAVIAHDCPCGRMHTMDDLVYLELLQDVEPVGENRAGEIVLTSLDSFGMPFIRYTTGDLGIQGKSGCSYGRGFGSLEGLEGRVTEYLYRVDGVPMPGLYLTNNLKRVSGVVDFQVEQISLTEFEIRLVCDHLFPEDGEQQIVDRLVQGLGAGLRVNFEYLEHIPRSKTGKKKWVISRLGS